MACMRLCNAMLRVPGDGAEPQLFPGRAGAQGRTAFEAQADAAAKAASDFEPRPVPPLAERLRERSLLRDALRDRVVAYEYVRPGGRRA